MSDSHVSKTLGAGNLDDESFSEKLSRSVMKFLPLRRFGWAFLLAWVFCVFYTSAAKGYVGGYENAAGLTLLPQLFYSSFPLFMSIAMLVVIVFAEKRFGSPTSHPKLMLAAPLATALSTPLLFITTPSTVVNVIVFTLGAVLTGFGSGLLWVMWGEYYAKLGRDEIEFLAPVSAAAAVLLILAVSSMAGWVSVVVATSFPLIAGVTLFLSWRDVSGISSSPDSWSVYEYNRLQSAHDLAKRTPLISLKSFARTGVGLLVACLIVCLEGSFWPLREDRGFEFQLVLLFSAAFMCVVAFGSTVSARRVNIPFLYRWMCPLLVLGFVSIIWFDGGAGLYIAYAISIAARLAFCLITQMYFANRAGTGEVTPTQSFGLGWICVHLGDWLGVISLVWLDPALENGQIGLDRFCAVVILLLVVVTMFVLNNQESFMSKVCAESKPIAETAGAQVDEEGPYSTRDFLEDRMDSLAEKYALTPREKEVFILLAHGRSIPYIRDELVISKDTAATHVKHIYTKLAVHSKQELLDLVQEEATFPV